MSEITEIIEETTNFLEIFVSGSGQIEVVGDSPTTIEVVESSFIDSRLQGSVTSSQNSISITGSNTTFTTDLIVGDTVKITSGSTSQVFKIASISSDLLLTLGGIWTGNTYTGSFISKQVVAGSIDDGDTLVTFETNTVAIESLLKGNTTVDITTDSPSQIEVTTSTPTVEIREKTLISGSVEFSYNNIINRPLTHNSSTGFISTPKVINPQYDFHVSGTFFSNEMSASKLNLNLNTTEDPFSNAFSVGINSSDPSFRVTNEGVTVLKKFNATPAPLVGAIIVSGSDYYLGFE
jgi:hypothetical protein